MKVYELVEVYYADDEWITDGFGYRISRKCTRKQLGVYVDKNRAEQEALKIVRESNKMRRIEYNACLLEKQLYRKTCMPNVCACYERACELDDDYFEMIYVNSIYVYD